MKRKTIRLFLMALCFLALTGCSMGGKKQTTYSHVSEKKEEEPIEEEYEPIEQEEFHDTSAKPDESSEEYYNSHIHTYTREEMYEDEKEEANYKEALQYADIKEPEHLIFDDDGNSYVIMEETSEGYQALSFMEYETYMLLLEKEGRKEE